MPRYTSRNIRSQWSEEALFRAVKCVKDGTPIRKASRDHGIPRSTLLRRLSVNPDVGKITLGGKPILGKMEAQLVTHILEMEKGLYGLTAIDVRKIAYQV